MSLRDVFYYFLLLAGLGAVMAAVFFMGMSKYDEWEQKVIAGISGYAAEIYDLLDKMYKRQPLNRCYLIITLATGISGFLGFVLGLQMSFVAAVFAAGIFAAVGFRLPGILIRAMFKRRLEKFDTQLVDALNMMSNAIKSGLSFMQVIQVLERELPMPASQEFGMVLKENRIGVNLNDALLNMSRRVPSADLFMIINSVVTLSQQGGDLSEAFDTIAITIRERQRVSEKIKTLATAGLMQATILSGLPFVLMGIFYLFQPNYTKLLFTTTLGLGMLAGIFLLIIVGALWMKKILTIDI